MSRNFNQNIIEYWRRLDFTRNVSDIINDQRRDRLGERDLKNLFTTLDISNVGNFYEEYNLANEKDKKKYKKILLDKLTKILKGSRNFNKQNVEKYYQILFADYKKLFDCGIKQNVPKITKNPLDQDTIDILKSTLDSFNMEPDENSLNIIEFEDINQYYIFLMIILAGDPLHDYTISRLSQFRNESVQNIRLNYSNIANTLFEEYKQCLNGSQVSDLVIEIKDLIVNQNNIEEGLMNKLLNFNINEQKNPQVNSLYIYENIKNFLDQKKQQEQTYRFASVNSVSRIHADDREPSISSYHTHFIQQSMNRTQYCLPSTMIDGCKGCCDDFSKVFNYNQSIELDRANIGVEIGNINIKFTYKNSRDNYLTIKSVINKKRNQNNEEIYNYVITISRMNNLSGLNLDNPFTFEREIYPDVDDITVSKMFSKYTDSSNNLIYGEILQHNNIMSNLNAHKYTEKMLCDFLQGAACYFKWGGYEIPSVDPRIQYPKIEYFPSENNILKYNENQTIDNLYLKNISNISTYNGNCIRVTEHTDRPAAILCHFILQSGFKNINDFAHAAYLGDSNGFLSNKDGIVVETLNVKTLNKKRRRDEARGDEARGGGFLDNKKYETYIDFDNDNRRVPDQDDIIVLFKENIENSENSENRENDIIIFADELPNNDTIRWASWFNYNEQQIHQINFITILVILNLDENEMDENEKQFVKFLKLDIDENRNPDVNNIYYKRYKHFFESIKYFKSNPEIFAKLFNTSIPVEVVLKKLVSPLEEFVKPLIKEKEESVKEEEEESSFSSNLSSDSGRVLFESPEASTVDSREGSPVDSREGSPLFGPQSTTSSQINWVPPLVVPLPEQKLEQKSVDSPQKLIGQLSTEGLDSSLKKSSGGNKRYRKTHKKNHKKKNKNKKTQKKVQKLNKKNHKKTHKKKYVKSKHHKTYKY